MNTINTNVTEKNIAAFEALRHFGKLLDGVKLGDKFIVEEYGEPVAALVPLAVYTQWKQERDAFFASIREMQTNANLDEEEAMKLANEAVKAVRAKTSTTSNKQI